VGAWRPQTVDDGVPHGGFYTQDDVREIVAYAARRFVRVLPEIELPGHTRAAIASYPQLGNHGLPVGVGTGWGIETRVLNVEEATAEFFEHVFEEVFELFPGEFVHVGGDECPRDEWRASPRGQQLSGRGVSRTRTGCRAGSSPGSTRSSPSAAVGSSAGTRSSKAASRRARR
jgi:hexosaminidase